MSFQNRSQGRPPVTGTTHILDFLRLDPKDFERMCFALDPDNAVMHVSVL